MTCACSGVGSGESANSGVSRLYDCCTGVCDSVAECSGAANSGVDSSGVESCGVDSSGVENSGVSSSAACDDGSADSSKSTAGSSGAKIGLSKLSGAGSTARCSGSVSCVATICNESASLNPSSGLTKPSASSDSSINCHSPLTLVSGSGSGEGASRLAIGAAGVTGAAVNSDIIAVSPSKITLSSPIHNSSSTSDAWNATGSSGTS